MSSLLVPETQRHQLIVVDDDSFFAERITRNLRGSKWSVRGFAAPFEALALFENGALPKAVIIDLNLPGLDGISLIKRISTLLHPTRIALFLTSEVTPMRDLKSEITAHQMEFHLKDVLTVKDSLISVLNTAH